MTVTLEEQLLQIKRELTADQAETDRRLNPERYASPSAPAPVTTEQAPPQKRPRDMTEAEFRAYHRTWEQNALAKQRAAAEAAATPQKHPRDMTDAEFKAYQREWEQAARARHG